MSIIRGPHWLKLDDLSLTSDIKVTARVIDNRELKNHDDDLVDDERR